MTDHELIPCMECGGTDCVIEADITRRIDGSIYVVMASARCRDCKSVGLGKHKNEKKAIQLAIQAWNGERPRYWFPKRETTPVQDVPSLSKQLDFFGLLLQGAKP